MSGVIPQITSTPSGITPRVLILGAGPCGLAAGHRLAELGVPFLILESTGSAGGSAGSFTDAQGFTWDADAHLLNSKHERFNNIYNTVLWKQLSEEPQDAVAHLGDRKVPHPVHLHLHRLPPDLQQRCLQELRSTAGAASRVPNENFRDALRRRFGPSLCELFFFPYYRKLWRTPLDELAGDWVDDHFQMQAWQSLLDHLLRGQPVEDPPAVRTMPYPQMGGIGAFYRALSNGRCAGRVLYHRSIDRIDLANKTVTSAGESFSYDYLISATALPDLLSWCKAGGPLPGAVLEAAAQLRGTRAITVGFGFSGPWSCDFHHSYHPGYDVPFHRVTVLSKLALANAPMRTHSLLAQVVQADGDPVGSDQAHLSAVREGLVRTGLMPDDSQTKIISTQIIRRTHLHAVPTLNTRAALRVVQGYLMENNILSRGRLGCWRYEIAKTDDAVMMGLEAADRIAGVGEETVWSL